MRVRRFGPKCDTRLIESNIAGKAIVVFNETDANHFRAASCCNGVHPFTISVNKERSVLRQNIRQLTLFFGHTGKVAEKALDDVHITVNKNTIPFDTNKPFVASGVRLGTPALTTRGMKEPEMRSIGEMIAAIIHEPESEEVKTRVKQQVAEITSRFPMYRLS